MSVFRESALADWTRGGQTTLHYLRMIGQVLKTFTKAAIFSLVVVSIGFVWLKTTSYERYVTYKYTVSKLAIWTSADWSFEKSQFDLKSSKTIYVSNGDVVKDPYIIRSVNKVYFTALTGVFVAAVAVLSLLFLVCIYIFRKGRAQREEEFLRGGKLVEGKELAALLRKKRLASDVKIAGIPLLKDSETRHILIEGTPGGGKSTAIKEIIDVIRKRGDRAIIYDTAGSYVENYYREGKDVLLNPLDERCPAWNIWSEASQPHDFDYVASSLIPEAKSGGDPFWVLAARTIFSAVAFKMSIEGEHSTEKLLNDLLAIKLEDAAELVEGTEAAAIIAEGAEKTALSVRATLATYIKSLKFLKRGQSEFSIRDWVKNEEGDSTIFISSRPEQKEALKGLISTWIEIAVSALLSLKEDPNRRIWLIVDELQSLNKLPSVSEFLAQSRKFGGCGLLGFQQYSQLSEIYGKDGATSLTGLCSTWVIYRANDPSTAEWASKAFGNVEIIEPNEGVSYGAHEMRDGVSMSAQRKTRPLVMPTEILNLNNLEGLIRIPGEFPSAKFTAKYKEKKQIAECFIASDLKNSSWYFGLENKAKAQGDGVIEDNGMLINERTGELLEQEDQDRSGQDKKQEAIKPKGNDDDLYHSL